jgi:hypothetical protein
MERSTLASTAHVAGRPVVLGPRKMLTLSPELLG